MSGSGLQAEERECFRLDLEWGGVDRRTAGRGVREEAQSAEAAGEGEFSERERLVDAMERAGWVQAKAARLLTLTPRQMATRCAKHGHRDQAILTGMRAAGAAIQRFITIRASRECGPCHRSVGVLKSSY